jgi:N-methylhydantoinase B
MARYEGPPAEAGPQIWADSAVYLDAPVVFRQLCCPGCGTAMLSTVVPVDHPLPVGGPGVGP